MEATARTTIMTPLESSPDHIFYSPPETLEVNESAWTDIIKVSGDDNLIDVLISQLAREGPFVALAQIGPEFYVKDPNPVNDTLPGVQVFGWEMGSPRVDTVLRSPVVILGARKVKKELSNRQYIYFSMSSDLTDGIGALRTHKVLERGKVYVVTYKNFQQSLLNTFPPVSAIARESSLEEPSYYDQLEALPLGSILDGGVYQEQCRKIGQAAFQEFKRSLGHSLQGRRALEDLYDLVFNKASSGPLRCWYISRAWIGIGDETWRWAFKPPAGSLHTFYT